MGRAKDKIIEQQDKANHLDCCGKCGSVLGSWEERQAGTCDDCFKEAVEKDWVIWGATLRLAPFLIYCEPATLPIVRLYCKAH